MDTGNGHTLKDVTNERCKVKCPVKSGGDLEQAAFTASGWLFNTANYLGYTQSFSQRDHGSESEACSFTDVTATQEAEMTEPSLGSFRRHGPFSLACVHIVV